VSGILIEHGRVLVEKRRIDDEADPGLVFLPGGHVESGESLKDALVRELKEELGIQARNIVPVGVRYHVASDGERQRVHYLRVQNWSGKIKSFEAETVYWETEGDNLADSAERQIVSRLLKESPRKTILEHR
jgi:8-oxo-dGTP diphosphatase